MNPTDTADTCQALSIEVSRYPATASVLPSAQGLPIRRKGHPTRRKSRSIRASVTVTISVSCRDWPNSHAREQFEGRGR
jgi:hypothetical protein